MNERDHRADEKLPYTGELGDEGGSYGDASVQAETFKGAAGNARVDPKRTAAQGQEAGSMNSEIQTTDSIKDAGEKPE